MEFAPSDEFRDARFSGVDFSGARFRDVVLRGVKIVDAILVDADISGVIDGLVINGVEVAPLVEAVDELLAELTDEQLRSTCLPNPAPGYPPSTEHTVLHCLQTLLIEEWQHRLYAERDLAVLVDG